VAPFPNGTAVPLDSVPVYALGDLPARAREAREDGQRLVALFTLGENAERRLMMIAGDAATGRLHARGFDVPADAKGFPSLTPDWPEAHLFEREVWEESGLVPHGHPWLKAVRRHAELEERGTLAPPHPFFRAEGEGVHEVAVGPIHAGVIEPGHFRFQCHGEEVLHLEIQLGYQHRGAEKMLADGTPARRLVVAESIAGDTSVGHALAHCSTVEALAGARVPIRAQIVRAVALELERLSNHVGDLGALCGDVGYLPGLSYFGALRGSFLNLLMELSGNRYGRGLLTPGGVKRDYTPELVKSLLARLDADEPDLRRTADLMFKTPSVTARFEGTGAVSAEDAARLGLVGPAARAAGLDRDARRDYPLGLYQFAHIPVSTATGGDVMARATVRWIETLRSIEFIRHEMEQLAPGPAAQPIADLRPDALAVAMVEGWRGKIAHVAVTGAAGRIARYKVVDPSFHNWYGLALAMRGEQISDFPLCNKSFNLSYAGHDL
jgi:Ni,Fe-hydrogenase III large subunit